MIHREHWTVGESSVFVVHSSPSNGLSPYCGTLVDVGGTVTLHANAWIQPWSAPTNGGSVLLRAREMTVDATSGVNADGKGFRGVNGTYGYGPGSGPGGGSNYSGSGYGGHGADGESGAAGGTYGYSNAPAMPGSAGGARNFVVVDGGGLVWLEIVGTLRIDGTLSADGLDAGPGGASSGGGILASCGRFVPSAAVLSANGGDSIGGRTGGAGGGRIAMWIGSVSQGNRDELMTGGLPGSMTVSTQWVDVTATASAGAPGSYGTTEDGTVVFLVPAPSGSVFVIR
jgi:hypothetical protein